MWTWLRMIPKMHDDQRRDLPKRRVLARRSNEQRRPTPERTVRSLEGNRVTSTSLTKHAPKTPPAEQPASRPAWQHVAGAVVEVQAKRQDGPVRVCVDDKSCLGCSSLREGVTRLEEQTT